MYDLNPSMKLMAFVKTAKQAGMAHSAFAMVETPYPQRGGTSFLPWGGGSVSSSLVYSEQQGLQQAETMVNQNGDHVGRSVLFSWDRYSVTDYDANMSGATFTHALDSKSFYTLSFSTMKEEKKNTVVGVGHIIASFIRRHVIARISKRIIHHFHSQNILIVWKNSHS